MQELEVEHAPKSQLIINRIILDNFKSYHGHLEIGPFNGSFTSIVGPNGSGKSNLIESMLFVFGKKASWMRLQKIQQLIHNSALHKDVKKASVEVQFAEQSGNTRTYFSIKRTVHYTGQSNYEINNKHATLEEVSTLLKSKGVDLQNNRFLVLQGEVEQISMMKPKSGDVDRPGLLEYLEDIIGSNTFQEKIDQKEQELITLDEQRKEKGEMMVVVEDDVLKLQPGKEKAVQLVKSEVAYYKILNIQQQISNFKIESEVQKCQEQLVMLDEQFRITAAESKEKTVENQQIVIQYSQAKQKVQACKRALEKHQANMDEIQELDAKNREDMNSLTTLQNKIQTKLNEIKTERNKNINETEDISKELPSIKKQLEQVRVEKDKLEEQILIMSQAHQSSVRKLVQKKSDLQSFLSEPTLQLNSHNKEIEIARNRLNELKLPDVDSYKGVQKSLEESLSTIQQFKTIMLTLLDTLKEIRNREKATQEQQDNLKKELRIIEEQITEIQQQIDGNQFQQNQQQEQNATVRAIMDAASKGQLKGVIGRIGDLASISRKYDVAVSTACGAGFESILVENQWAAEQCVNFLRNNKIGRYTFICLEQVRKLYSQEQWTRKMNLPPQTERLFDLIKISNPEYTPAIFKICGQTLVCDNIDIARRLKFDQKVNGRFVTLDGKLIEANGVMSGGGQQQRSGALKLDGLGGDKNATKQDQTQLENELKKLQQNRQRLEQLLLQSDHEYNTLFKDEKIVADKYYQAEQDLRKQVNLKEDLEAKIQKNKNLEAQLVDIQEQRKKMESIILENQKQVDIINKQTAKERGELQTIEQQIIESENKEFKQLKETLKQQTAKFEKLDNELKIRQSRLQMNEKKLIQMDHNEKTDGEDLIKLEKKIANLRADFEKTEKACIELIALQKIAQVDFQNAEAEYKDTQQRNQEFTELIAQLKEKLQKMKTDKYDLETLAKKKSQELNTGIAKLGQIHQNFNELRNEYDFLDQIEEIANWKIENESEEAQQDKKEPLINLSVFQNEDSDNEVDQKQPLLNAVDLEAILSNGVTQSLKGDELMQLCPLEKEIARFSVLYQTQIQSLTQEANVNDIQEFKKKYIEYKLRKEELEICKQSIIETKQLLRYLKEERLNLFKQGYIIIGARLRDTYRILTGGGDAELELVDTADPFKDGIIFSVRPKNKSWKLIAKLSGGEKTLASLSLIFALHQYKPTPIYFFDEVDAALDYKNVQIIAKFIRERTSDAQFIVISLRNNMFENADQLLGIYKTSDMTKIINMLTELPPPLLEIDFNSPVNEQQLLSELKRLDVDEDADEDEEEIQQE